jgi:hypothetical protein
MAALLGSKLLALSQVHGVTPTLTNSLIIDSKRGGLASIWET